MPIVVRFFFSLAPFRSRSSRFEPGDIVSASNARAGRERKLVHGPTESSRAHSKKKLAASSSFDGRRKLALACSLVPSRPSLVLSRSPASVPKQPPFLNLLTQIKNTGYSRPVVADHAQLSQPARTAAAAVFLAVVMRRRLAVRFCHRGHRRRAPANGVGGSGAGGLRRRRGRRGQGAVRAGERREDTPGEEGKGHG